MDDDTDDAIRLADWLDYFSEFVEGHGIGVGDECDAPRVRDAAATIRRLSASLSAARSRIAEMESARMTVQDIMVGADLEELEQLRSRIAEVELVRDTFRESAKSAIDAGIQLLSERDTARAEVARLERELAGRTVPGQCPWDLPFDAICPKHSGPLAHCPINKANSGITFDRETT